MIIQNFATLSQEELNQFAKKLVDKINAEHLITNEVKFTIRKAPDAVWAHDTTGDLIINLDEVHNITSTVGATWAAPKGDAYAYEESTVDMEEPIFDDVFKKDFVIDGYKVAVDVDYYDLVETEDVEVYDYKRDFDFWGNVYLDVTGAFINTYSVALSLVVEPVEPVELVTDKPVPKPIVYTVDLTNEEIKKQVKGSLGIRNPACDLTAVIVNPETSEVTYTVKSTLWGEKEHKVICNDIHNWPLIIKKEN